jgi:hypothetical protein
MAPASGFSEAKLVEGISRIEAMGYRVEDGKYIHERFGQYYAGTPTQRAEDLNRMFADPEIKAILRARGLRISEPVVAARSQCGPQQSEANSWMLGYFRAAIVVARSDRAGEFARADGGGRFRAGRRD